MAQQALDTWEWLINVNDGALAPENSYWCLIYINSDGQHADPEATPGELILNNKGDPVVIEHLAVTEAKETLGIWSRPDGSMHDEVQSQKTKAKKWADAVQTRHINPTIAWCSVTIMKTIEYPLMATCISRKGMDDIMRPILQAALPKAAIQKRFPRKLVLGSLGFQGFGLHHPSNSQLIEHLQAIVTHSHRDSPSHNLHLQNLELVQCYVRSELPFWDLPYQLHGHLAPKGWIQFTWEELSATKLSLRGPLGYYSFQLRI